MVCFLYRAAVVGDAGGSRCGFGWTRGDAADAQIRVAFVIPEEDVVLGVQHLDQVVFQQQGLRLGAHRRGFHADDLADHVADAGAVMGFLEITADAFFQVVGLADIQHLVLRIEIPVDAWQGRQRCHLGQQGLVKPGAGLAFVWLVSAQPGLPLAHIGHAGPGLGHGQGLPGLQQFHGDVVWGPHKGHVAVTWWAQDGNAMGLQALTGGVDVVHGVGQVAKVAATCQLLGIPVVGEFHLGLAVARCRQEHQGEAARGNLFGSQHFQPQGITVEGQRFFEVGDPNHGVQIAHVTKAVKKKTNFNSGGWGQRTKDLCQPCAGFDA